MSYLLGLDLGSTKTHALIADETGRALGFGEGGPANHESVGYDGMVQSMRDALEQALRAAGVDKADIAGAGFGVAGYDWSSEYEMTESAIHRLGINAPIKFVNDAVLGILAGAQEGWGIAVVSGTGCNCRGWDKDHKREGRVTGHGLLMGEGAGGTELVHRAMQMVNYSWTKRLPKTALSQAFIAHAGAKNLEDLIEGYSSGGYEIGAEAAPIVFQVAKDGDKIALDLICWAGRELGELVNSVARQLEFENLEFDVVMTGGMFRGGDLLIDPMRERIHQVAPKARLVKLSVPPVVGAVLLGMEAGGLKASQVVRQTMMDTLSTIKQSM